MQVKFELGGHLHTFVWVMALSWIRFRLLQNAYLLFCGTKICTLYFQFFNAIFASKGYPFKNIFDFTTAGDWDCVAAVESLPALHYSVDFIFLSFGIMGFIVEL